jgi:hypothetical protein
MTDPMRDLKRELLAAAERQQAHAAVAADRGQSRPRRTSRLLVAASIPIAAAVALVFTAPWESSHGFLERAEAALTPPPGAILHQRLETTVSSRDFGCTITARPSEMWIDQMPPRRWRVRAEGFLGPVAPGVDPHTFACARGGVTELGGSSVATQTLEFVIPNTLMFSRRPYISPPGDQGYVATLREAIAAGIAFDEGATELDGRTVERIRIEHQCLEPPCAEAPSYTYVDPQSFFPVQEVLPSGYVIVNRDGVFRFDVVVRYLEFEYLPRTAANVALTDIREQHPDANGP